MRTLSPLALAALPLVLVTGCKGDPCSKSYERMQACAPAESKDAMPKKDAFVKTCKEEMEKATGDDKKWSDEAAACSDKTDCAEYQSCLEDVSKKRMRSRTLANVAKAMDSKDYEDALMDCRISADMYGDDQEIADACAKLRAAALEGMMAAVTKIRDEGGDSIGPCVDLESVAEGVSPDAKAKAATLCQEARAAERAKEARDEAQKNVDAKTAEVPTSCSLAMDDLAALDTEWATKTKKEVATVCYQELGKIILPQKVPGMQYVCDYHVKTIYDAVKANGLSDPELDPWIQKASALCEKDG